MAHENRTPRDIPHEWKEFFFLFSRMEYALKHCGFLLNENSGAKAEPNWDRFANSLQASFLEDTKRKQCVTEFCDVPPKKQVVGLDHRLEWQDSEPVSDNRSLFLALRTMRNNLFHGGKSEDPFNERSRLLLQAGIEIIHAALDSDPKLARRFEHGY